MIYNDNITLIRATTKPGKLRDNEYYVLMVTDDVNKHERPKEDYWNYEKAYVGVEQTSNNVIYISKKFQNRHDSIRGITFIASVVDASKCLDLTY